MMAGQAVVWVLLATVCLSGHALCGVSGLAEKRDFNELSQATQIEVLRGTQLVHRLGYTYPATGNNGNVTGHSITTPQRKWN